jgi:hypothetical protein
VRDSLPVVGWVGIKAPEEMARKAMEFVNSGHQILKLKLGTTVRDDVQRVKAVREAVGHGVKMRVDVNGHFSLTDCLALARGIADYDIEFIEDKNTIRLEVRRLMEELLAEEEKIDAAARQKIESQKRTITEGSVEWDILYRKYYNEEVKKLGI